MTLIHTVLLSDTILLRYGLDRKRHDNGRPKEGARGGREEITETHFEFDRVFKPESSQERVFEAVSPLVTSVLDG